jgi:hypothetical protein
MGALGSQSGNSKSQVSRICQETGYSEVNATYVMGRLGKALQVCPSAVVVAMGANSAALRSVFAQETVGEILSHWDDLGTSPAKCFHKAAEL